MIGKSSFGGANPDSSWGGSAAREKEGRAIKINLARFVDMPLGECGVHLESKVPCPKFLASIWRPNQSALSLVFSANGACK